MIRVFLLSLIASMHLTKLTTAVLFCYSGEYFQINGQYTFHEGGVRPLYGNLYLCAFREYQGRFNGSSYLHRSYLSLNVTNALRSISKTRCQGFSNDSDIGFGQCTPLPFELHTMTKLCICQTDGCNRNFSTCQSSVTTNQVRPAAPSRMIPRPINKIECEDNTLISGYDFVHYTYTTYLMSYLCLTRGVYLSGMGQSVPNSLIDRTLCDTYIRNNTNVCGIQARESSGDSVYIDSIQVSWNGDRKIRMTTENFESIIEEYLNGNSDNPVATTIYRSIVYHGNTSIIVRRLVFDLVGNPLAENSIHCFCWTDHCNTDFETCATGVDYHSTNISFTHSPPMNYSMQSTTVLTTTQTHRSPSNMSLSFPVPLPPPLAFYTFDGNALDLQGNYNGSLAGGMTYASFGYIRRALVISKITHYFQTSFINLAFQNFTISGWILVNKNQNVTIFSECSVKAARRCLNAGIDNQTLFMDFFGGFNITGASTIGLSRWYHVAFVYDMAAKQQRIYLNGMIDGQSELDSTPPYLGTCQYVRLAVNFLGMLDHFSIDNRVKSPEEILREATLVASYSFEGDMNDDGPNNLNGSGVITYDSNGIIGQCISLNGNETISITAGMTVFSMIDQSFSISVWVKPTYNLGETNFLTAWTSSWCMPLLGLSSSNAILFRINGVAVLGDILPMGQWSHLAYVYGSTGGVQYFINGTLVQMLHTTFTRSNLPANLTIGTTIPSGSTCAVRQNRFIGFIDELKVYSRALNSNDIDQLFRF